MDRGSKRLDELMASARAADSEGRDRGRAVPGNVDGQQFTNRNL
jgi:hypothetical protein